MGLAEQINNNPKKRFSRTNTQITTAGSGLLSGSVGTLGGAYVLLSAQANTSPCRIRLYNTSASINLDRSRSETTFDIEDTVGLVADIVLTSTDKLEFTPPILGFPLKDGLTWYNISASSATATTVTIETYPFVQDNDSISDKATIELITKNINTTGNGESGSLSTPGSFVILTGSVVQNLSLDPNYSAGSLVSCDGWQFLYTTKSATDLTEADGVPEPFPGYGNAIAAKVGSRTSAYYIACAQQTVPVTVGNTYRISGYAHGNNTTPDSVGGARYPVGFYVQSLDGAASSLGYHLLTSSLNPSGWSYLTKDIYVGAGTASIQMGPFIDGPYPRGYSLFPECSVEQNSRGCPGYGWFVGPTVVNLSAGEIDGVASRVKLYSTPINQIPTTEFTRSITSIPANNSKLIGDFSFDSSSRMYNLSPVVEGYTWTNSAYITGTRRAGYQILNLSTGSANFVVSLLTHKLEN